MPAAPPLTQPLPDLASWTARLRGAEIPVLAETAEALELLRGNEDEVDANRLGELIGADPLMTLKVLAYAAAHRSERLLTDAETVTAALVLMGISPFFRAFGPQPVVEDQLGPQALDGLQRVLRRSERAARYALSFAVHRLDPDAAVIHSAALLHDFAELLLWVHAPDLALRLEAHMQADRSLSSEQAQRDVLNIELNELEQALMQAWRLPALLRQVTDDHLRAIDPKVLAVRLAVRLAQHTDEGWGHPAVAEDLRDIGELLSLAPAHVQSLLHQYD
ncbi:HDOD domain-containing protein [Pelomonas sp. KK5]|uniref:HDOD domain-containing protein n=1 Tax=Pelomonas sp. KK5 TaxID=1855730 RepID=UPI00097BD76B|nr:HDOD domain-containing protein [Pelomonas sp. KK5]